MINNGGCPHVDMALTLYVWLCTNDAKVYLHFKRRSQTLVLFTCSAAVFFVSFFLLKVRGHCSTMPVRFPNKTQPPPEHYCPFSVI